MSTPLDDNISAEQRGIGSQMRCFRVDISASAAVKTIILPYDIKVCAVRSPVAAELSLAYKADNDATPTPADATAGNLSTKLPLEAAVREPIAQENEFNVLYIKPSATDATRVLIWIGSGASNGLTGSGYVS